MEAVAIGCPARTINPLASPAVKRTMMLLIPGHLACLGLFWHILSRSILEVQTDYLSCMQTASCLSVECTCTSGQALQRSSSVLSLEIRHLGHPE